MIYLASPYSHQDYHTRVARYAAAQEYAVAAMKEGWVIFSPIVYGHTFSAMQGLPFNYEYWQKFNDHMLLGSKGVIVLRIPGWKESRGVDYEVGLAVKNNIPVTYADPFK